MKITSIVLITIYNSLLAISSLIFALMLLDNYFSFSNSQIKLWLLCSVFGSAGGATYCLRGIYLNYSVRNNWELQWIPWYFIRPIVSLITGFFSFLFIKAFLLLLETEQSKESTYVAYYLLSFIAGLNVDNFVKRIEEIGKLIWSIEPSRISRKDDGPNG